MSDGSVDITVDHDAQARDLPLEAINVAQPGLFQADAIWPYFARLRRDDPVHFCADSEYGSYWSVTKFNDIMAVETNHQVFSSEASLGGITISGRPEETRQRGSFISMDPPKHDVQRKTVSPVVSPNNLTFMEPLIRQRAGDILDSLPIGEEFDWVDKVSIELTTMTLATLFDFPFEERRLLTKWSDIATAVPGGGLVNSIAERQEKLEECWDYFDDLLVQRRGAPPAGDLVSMLAHGAATREMDAGEYHGNVMLLIIGGNDTTRNTISGSVNALNQHPDQYALLRENQSLIPSMVSETIRWQTPLAHMRRTAREDIEFQGKTIRAGEKVVMWYVSGNRDGEVIEDADQYLIARERPRHHVSFGFGVHRCVGNRLAELQLKVIWEEIFARFPTIEVVGPPKRSYSTFVHGYEHLPVVIPGRN